MNEEKEYEQLRKLGQKLHVPIPETKWKLEVLLGGKIVQIYEARSHSWVRNAYNLLFCQLACKAPSPANYGSGELGIKDTGATVRGAALSASSVKMGYNPDTPGLYGYLAQATKINHGIVVGSGVNAEDFEDFALQTPITEGVGAGQLNSIASENHSISYAALALKDEQARYFNNNSGGDVTVNEVALITNGHINTDHPWLFARDHLASPVVIPDTGQLKVTYTISLTYPS